MKLRSGNKARSGSKLLGFLDAHRLIVWPSLKFSVEGIDAGWNDGNLEADLNRVGSGHICSAY